MSYDDNVDGYAIEGSFKDGTTIDDNADLAYLIGALATKNIWPSPKYSAVYVATGVNKREVSAGKVFKSRAEYRGMLTFAFMNGVPLMLAMGLSSTSDDDPEAGLYTHTITPHSDGSLIPSVVWQHEEKGDNVTDEEYQFQGCKVDSLVLSHDMSGPDCLMGKMEIMGGTAIDPAFALANDPALPTGSNNEEYSSLTATWDYGNGALDIDGLENVEITILNTLEGKYAHSRDGGVYTGRDPYMLKENRRKDYKVVMELHPTTIERAIWDELITAANTKELYFKWSRDDTEDFIELICTDCMVLDHEIITEDVKTLKVVTIEMEPRAVSFTVVDSIAGDAGGGYNE